MPPLLLLVHAWRLAGWMGMHGPLLETWQKLKAGDCCLLLTPLATDGRSAPGLQGFEPLDSPGLSADQKLAFFEAVFSFPDSPAAFPAWRAALAPPVPGLRVERQALRSFSQLAGKSVAGFKLRPFTHEAAVPSVGQQPGSEDANGGSGGSSAIVSGRTAGAQQSGGQLAALASAPDSAAAAATSNSTQRGHTALTGLDPAAVRELLHRHNVSVLLTVRRNAVKEALSWHKARDLGVSQFNELRAARAAQAGGSSRSSSSKADSRSGLLLSDGKPAKDGGGARAAAASRQAAAQRLLQAAAEQEAAQLAACAGDKAHPADKPSSSSSSSSSSHISGSRAGSPGAATQQAAHVDIPRLLHWLAYTDRVNAELRAAVAYYGRPTLTIWYEDFLADPLGQARRAAEFIGVPPAALAQLQPSSKFRKAGPDALRDSVANFGVRAAACGNGTAAWLELPSIE